MSSASIRATYRPRASRRPALRAAATPPRRSRRRTLSRWSGSSARMSAVWSPDASSTTTISKFRYVWTKMLSRDAGRNAAALRAGISTVTRGSSPIGVPPPAGEPGTDQPSRASAGRPDATHDPIPDDLVPRLRPAAADAPEEFAAHVLRRKFEARDREWIEPPADRPRRYHREGGVESGFPRGSSHTSVLLAARVREQPWGRESEPFELRARAG